MTAENVLKLKIGAEKIEGLVVTLTILDGYPGEYNKKMKTAYHCLHSCLECSIQEFANDLDDIENAQKSA